MPKVVPFTGHPQEAMSITIGGRSLRLRARYEHIGRIWKLDVFDNSGDTPIPLAMGIPILMGIELLKPYRLGIGGMFAEPTSDPRTDAGRGDLGSRIRLISYTQEELDALSES